MKPALSNFYVVGIVLLLSLFIFPVTLQDEYENRYTKEANVNFREMEKPFRMAKMNMVWHKAQQVHL